MRFLVPIAALAVAILQSQGTIEGTVTQKGTSVPIAAVRITLRIPTRDGRSSKATRFAARTASDGHFVLRDVPPGPYTVIAERKGYFGVVPNNGVLGFATNDSGVAVTLRPQEHIINVRLS